MKNIRRLTKLALAGALVSLLEIVVVLFIVPLLTASLVIGIAMILEEAVVALKRWIKVEAKSTAQSLKKLEEKLK